MNRLRRGVLVAALALVAATEGLALAGEAPFVGMPVALSKKGAKNNSVPAQFTGRIDFVSGGVVLYQEITDVNYQNVDGALNNYFFNINGAGNNATFETFFVSNNTNILTAPQLGVRVYQSVNGVWTLRQEQDFPASGISAWSVHSLDTVALQAADTKAAADLAAETAARKAADSVLQSSITNEVTTRATADLNLVQMIQNEADRAVATEQNIQVIVQNGNNNAAALVAAETAARQAADASLQAAINAEIAARKQGDIDTLASAKIYTDAQVALEAAARSAADATLTANLNKEIARATAAEATITTNLNNEVTRAKAAELALQAAIDAINNGGNGLLAQAKLYTDQQLAIEIAARKQGDADTLGAAKVYTDAQVALEAAARAAADTALTNALDTEIARAKAAELALQNAIDAETTRAKAAEAQLGTDVAAETARAKAAEAAETARATAAEAAETARATGAEAAITTNLNNEVARATGAETQLATDLAAEVVRAKAAEAAAAGDAAAEAARAKAAEAALQMSIDAETARAKAAETQLGADLAAEVARATAAEATKANVTLNNLANVAVNTSLLPGAANSINVGSGAKTWKTLFLTNNSNATAGINFQPSGGGNQTLLQAAPATAATRTITFPDASGVVAVSASGNIALDGAGNVTFTGILPIANGGTNNNSFTYNKFIVFDGAKLASSTYDSTSFAAANASITVTAGAGLSGGGNVALGGTVTLANAGVTGLVGGGGVSVSGAVGNISLNTTAGGDLSGALDTAVVTGLRGRPVAAAAPSAGQVLAWDGAAWAPANGAAGSVTGTGNINRVAKWTAGSNIANSSITDDGSTVGVAVPVNATALGIGGDVRTSWNGSDANAVNPMPRTCSPGQVAVARGNYQWQCSVICPFGAADCDNNANNGCEVIVASDKNNCGSCGVVCSTNNIPAPSCSQGVCNGACTAGFADCNGNKQSDGCEVGIATDANNCGACGVICSPNHISSRTCSGGLCNGTCDAGFADCNGNKQTDGCETSVAADPNNCGGCGFVCSNLNMASRTCGGGTCNGSCNAGFADCNGNKLADGCESNLSADVLNCGGCAVQCSTNNVNRACGGGSCQAGSCNAGFADCNNNKQADGCEINITNNVNNCGQCGKACAAVANGTQACTASACVIGACNPDFFNVNGQYADGCECNAPGINACGSAINLGQIGWAGQVVQNGVAPGGIGEHWYTLNFANSGAAYHPHVYINSGANYVLDVFNGCGGGQFNCGEGGTSTGTTNWEVNQTAGDPGTGSGTFTWTTPSPGTQLYVRVRATANTGCSGYQVVFVNG